MIFGYCLGLHLSKAGGKRVQFLLEIRKEADRGVRCGRRHLRRGRNSHRGIWAALAISLRMAASVEGRIPCWNAVIMLVGGELRWKCHWREAGALVIGIILH